MRLAMLFLTLAAAAQTRPDAAPEAVTSQKAKLNLLWEKMVDRIGEADRSLPGVLGAAVLDLTDGREYELHGRQIFPTASSIKVAVLAELCRQGKLSELYVVDAKDLVPESIILEWLTPGVSRVTNHDLACFMIGVSDNGATNVLIDRVGMDNVNTMLEGLGLGQTRLRRRMIDLAAARAGRENTSTPLEMVRLMEALYRGKVAGSEDALRILKLPKDQHYLLKKPPEGLVIANKFGSLDGVRTDTGIFYVAGRPYIVSVMTAYLQDGDAGEAAINKIGWAAYEYFKAVGSSSVYGRELPR
jgi:beta-lactamase class A